MGLPWRLLLLFQKQQLQNNIRRMFLHEIPLEFPHTIGINLDFTISPKSHAYPTYPTSLTKGHLKSFTPLLPLQLPSLFPSLCNLNATTAQRQAMTLLLVCSRWTPSLLNRGAIARYCPQELTIPRGRGRGRGATLAMDGPCLHRFFCFSRAQLDEPKKAKSGDPRIDDLGRAIEDDFATIRQNYATPKNPIVLAHGLLGFDELKVAGGLLPGVQYWRGITEAMRANGIEVIIASVPASGSIEERATKLGQDIAHKANGKSVNIIAHSMGGLDARCMISRLQPENVNVLSLTTVATPHRGSSFADYCLEQIGQDNVQHLYKAWGKLGLGTGAFQELTRKYMREEFNPSTPDDPMVRYFSYGAVFTPSIWSAFRQPHRVVQDVEGPNDGLVSVESARWGTYKGTLVEVSHLDLINWTNRLKFFWYTQVWGQERKFNAIAFYLDIADMLAKEGL